MRKAQSGYTIMEVLIFLAISGAMFVVAFFGMRSQQDSVGFRQSLDAIELKIRGIFNNVDNGYFGNTGEFTCQAPQALGFRVVVSQEASEGGSNGECVFIGKTIDFSGGSSQMNIATLIGSRLTKNELSYSDGTIKEEPLLAETYTINNSVKWSSSRLYDAVTDSSTEVVGVLRVSAQRDRNAAADLAQANLRAQRKYNIESGSGWPVVSNSNIPMFCFALGDKNGSIKITQNDITVDYNGVGCPTTQ
jgi:hypothetical protein